MGPSHSRCKPELLRHDRSIGCLQITCLLRNLVVYSLWICQSHERILHRKAPFGGSRRWNHEKLVFYAERAGKETGGKEEKGDKEEKEEKEEKKEKKEKKEKRKKTEKEEKEEKEENKEKKAERKSK